MAEGYVFEPGSSTFEPGYTDVTPQTSAASDRASTLSAMEAVVASAEDIRGMVEDLQERLFGTGHVRATHAESPEQPSGFFPVFWDFMGQVSHAHQDTRDALRGILERLA